jgi:aerobic-type carbon monoxide dehydrogenase small subunit (CoxS/CutS family)
LCDERLARLLWRRTASSGSTNGASAKATIVATGGLTRALSPQLDDDAAPGALPRPDDDQIRHYLSGNLCRCAAYPEIVQAVKIAARKRKQS